MRKVLAVVVEHRAATDQRLQQTLLLSNLIAWPSRYFAMERWLQNFAYRIDLTTAQCIAYGLIALCIAWVTVGGTAAKAASAKPVLALRYEWIDLGFHAVNNFFLTLILCSCARACAKLWAVCMRHKVRL